MDGTPTLQDLLGAWYSPLTMTDAAVAPHRRLRFDESTYTLVYNTGQNYCAETGAFDLTGSQLQFHPARVVGFGDCVSGGDRVATIAWTALGIALEDATGVIPYLRARAVPKIFATAEKHDGNLAGDTTLPGNNAIEKGDALCNASLAKPDEARYKVLLIDGKNRAASPANDWVLKPNTTYFQADGVLNVLTSNSSGLASNEVHHPVISDYAGHYAWSGIGCDFNGQLTCSGWTRNGDTSDSEDEALIVSPESTSIFACNVSVNCQYAAGFLCVSVVADAGGESPDGGVDGGTVAADLQGMWVTAVGFAGGVREGKRLRFEDSRYSLVREIGSLVSGTQSLYCSEVGTFEVTAAGAHFRPDRVVGYGPCTIGPDRVGALSLTGTAMSLSDQGQVTEYTRAADVSRLFVTVEAHNGDFAGDTLLPGASALEKADAFCEQSSARPDGQRYKALLVDGSSRGVSPPMNTPLKTNAIYYDAWGTHQIIQTDAGGALASRFDATILSYPLYMWTGFDYDWKTTDTCKGWTSGSMKDTGATADAHGQPPLNYSVGGECGVWDYGLFCVSQ